MKDLRLHLQKSLIWTGLQHWGVHAIKLGVLFGVARFVGPESFGIYALATTLVSLAQIISNQGMMSAVVQRHDLRERHIGTAFSSMLAWAILLASIFALAARPIAALVAHPAQVHRVASFTQILSISLLLNAVSGMSLTRWRRDLLYKKIAIVTTVCQLVASVVAIVLAIGGAGIWSLVARQLVEATLMLFFTVRAAPWGFLRHSSWTSYREMLHVAGPMGGVNLMIIGRSRVDELIIGSWFGAETLGYYALARRQIETVASLVPAVIGNAFSPILARLQKDQHRLQVVTEQAIRLMGALVFPAFGIVAATSNEWFPLLLGQRWTPAASLLPAFAAGAAMTALLNFNLSILVATGHPRLRLMIEAIATIGVLVVSIAALPLGVKGVAYCSALAIALLVPIELFWISSRIPLTILQQARILAPALGNTILMVCVLQALRIAMANHLNGWSRLSILLIAGVPFFARDMRRFIRKFSQDKNMDVPGMLVE